MHEIYLLLQSLKENIVVELSIQEAVEVYFFYKNFNWQIFKSTDFDLELKYKLIYKLCMR